MPAKKKLSKRNKKPTDKDGKASAPLGETIKPTRKKRKKPSKTTKARVTKPRDKLMTPVGQAQTPHHWNVTITAKQLGGAWERYKKRRGEHGKHFTMESWLVYLRLSKETWKDLLRHPEDERHQLAMMIKQEMISGLVDEVLDKNGSAFRLLACYDRAEYSAKPTEIDLEAEGHVTRITFVRATGEKE